MIIRIPLIKELNFTNFNQEAFYNFFNKIKPRKVELMRLHRLGFPKYKALGKKCPKFSPPDKHVVKAFCKRLNAIGINAKLLH